MLKFDAETTRLLDIAYVGADVTRRRRASFDALSPLPRDNIVDIGCGNGFLTQELGRAVGQSGKVIGVDPSEEMRRVAVARCADLDSVEFVEGSADRIPIEDGSVDKAVSVQVFEYLHDIPAAIKEAYRVLKPGGLLVVGDLHFDSLIWLSDQPDRMQRMIDAWDNHFTERCVPAMLPKIMRDSGFTVENLKPLTICDHVLKPDGLANMMLRLMERYAVDNDHVTRSVAKAWVDEQEDLAKQGRFFFSITHFVVSARKL